MMRMGYVSCTSNGAMAVPAVRGARASETAAFGRHAPHKQPVTLHARFMGKQRIHCPSMAACLAWPRRQSADKATLEGHMQAAPVGRGQPCKGRLLAPNGILMLGHQMGGPLPELLQVEGASADDGGVPLAGSHAAVRQ